MVGKLQFLDNIIYTLFDNSPLLNISYGNKNFALYSGASEAVML